MRFHKTKTAHKVFYYGIDSYYRNGKSTSKVSRRFGSHDDLLETLEGQDPETWVRAEIARLNAEKTEASKPQSILFDPARRAIHRFSTYNAGYLFLQKIFHLLALPELCQKIASSMAFKYDLAEILACLVYGRILFPSSKLSTYEQARVFLEQPSFATHDLYRALDVLASSNDLIQAQLYKNSLALGKRRTKILYYDCTNYFFELEESQGLKQYGLSKEHRPNPIVQMGMFMDAEGIPLAFHLFPGGENEQPSLLPLEKKILRDFDCAKFIVCTDAGLASQANREFNTKEERAFITTQSIKKLKKHLKAWALDPEGWKLPGQGRLYDLRELNEELGDPNNDLNKIFYKERWTNENDFEQRLLVSFSLKYRNYQRTIRQGQVDRALAAMQKSKTKLDKKAANDYRRFVKKMAVTGDGEIAQKAVYVLDQEKFLEEALYDGFYAICTNLNGAAAEIIKVNKGRWQIEECFRLFKSEFRARPVYLQNDQRIQAHFMICFIALIVFRHLERMLDAEAKGFSASQLIQALKDMNFTSIRGEGHIPAYASDPIKDALNECFDFRTDYELYTPKHLRQLISASKKKNNKTKLARSRP